MEHLRWGATGEEVRSAVSGDQFLAEVNLTATRAMTIRAPAAKVWPWLAQLGQGRGVFYSYDWLENFVGCNMHSANRVVPQWQSIAVGEAVRLHPDVGLIVAQVEPGRVLVLRGGVPVGTAPAPYDFTWASFCATEWTIGPGSSSGSVTATRAGGPGYSSNQSS